MDFLGMLGTIFGLASDIFNAVQQARENKEDLQEIVESVEMIEAFLKRHEQRLVFLSETRAEVRINLAKIQGVIANILHHTEKVTKKNSTVWNWYRAADYQIRQEKFTQQLNNYLQSLNVFVSTDLESPKAAPAQSQAPTPDLSPGDRQRLDGIFWMVNNVQTAVFNAEKRLSERMNTADQVQLMQFRQLYNQQQALQQELVQKVGAILSAANSGSAEYAAAMKEIVSVVQAATDTAKSLLRPNDKLGQSDPGLEVLETLQQSLTSTLKEASSKLLIDIPMKAEVLKSVERNIDTAASDAWNAYGRLEDKLSAITLMFQDSEAAVVEKTAKALRSEFLTSQKTLTDKLEEVKSATVQAMSGAAGVSLKAIDDVKDIVKLQQRELINTQSKSFAEVRGSMERIAAEQRSSREKIAALMTVTEAAQRRITEESQAVAATVRSEVRALAETLPLAVRSQLESVLTSQLAALQSALEATIVKQTQLMLDKQDQLATKLDDATVQLTEEIKSVKELLISARFLSDKAVESEVETHWGQCTKVLRDDLSTYYKAVFHSITIMAGSGGTELPFDEAFMGCKFSEGCKLESVMQFAQDHAEEAVSCILVGAPGNGKTLVLQFGARQQFGPPDTIALYIDLGRVKMELDRAAATGIDRDLLLTVALSQWQSLFTWNKVSVPFDNAKKALLRHRIVWLVDGFDSIAQLTPSDRLFDAFRLFIKSCFDAESGFRRRSDVIMLTVRPDNLKALPLATATPRNMFTVEMRRWSSYDVDDYAQSYFAAYARSRHDEDLSWIEEAMIIIRAGFENASMVLWEGIPLIYDILCGWVVDCILNDEEIVDICPWRLFDYALRRLHQREAEKGADPRLVSYEVAVAQATAIANRCAKGDESFVVDPVKSDAEYTLLRVGWLTTTEATVEQFPAADEGSPLQNSFDSDRSSSQSSSSSGKSSFGSSSPTSKSSNSNTVGIRARRKQRKETAADRSHSRLNKAGAVKFTHRAFADYFLARASLALLDNDGSAQARLKEILPMKAVMSLATHALCYERWSAPDAAAKEVAVSRIARYLRLLKQNIEEKYSANRKECAAELSHHKCTEAQRQRWRDFFFVDQIVEAFCLLSDFSAAEMQTLFKCKVSTIWLPTLTLAPVCRFGKFDLLQTVVQQMSGDQLREDVLREALLRTMNASHRLAMKRVLLEEEEAVSERWKGSFVDIREESYSDVLCCELLRSLGAKASLADACAAGHYLALPALLEMGAVCGKERSMVRGLSAAVHGNQLDCIDVMLALMEDCHGCVILDDSCIAYNSGGARLKHQLRYKARRIRVLHIDALRMLVQQADNCRKFTELREVDLMYLPPAQLQHVTKEMLDAIRSACIQSVSVVPPTNADAALKEACC